MRIPIPALIAAGIAPTRASAFALPLAAACDRFGINTPQRAAGFLGQCVVESMQFAALVENLNYRPEALARIFPSSVKGDAAALCAKGPEAIANRVYAGKNGNGNEASGDGWRYRGRGLIQLTGRANYLLAEQAIGEPYESQPEIVALPDGACLTAAHYWERAGCNTLADMGNWDGCTRAVNGAAMLHRAERAAASERVLEALRA